MTPQPDPTIAAFKQSIRQTALANRQSQPEKDALSNAICSALAALQEYQAARTVLFYVDARAEVRTRPFLPSVWAAGKQVAVPYCQDGELALFHLKSLNDLASGSYRILEPRPELRSQTARSIAVEQVDLVVVPGVAFDRHGGRLGHGQGYYDKLLARARPETHRVALAFECQIFPTLPTAPHDVPMHGIVTERAIYRPGQPPVVHARR